VIHRYDQARLRADASAPAGVAGRQVRSASGTDWRRKTVAMLCGIVLATAPGVSTSQVDRLPDLGAASADELSGAAERRLGESIMRELRSAGMVWDDAEFTDYLNRFAARLTATGPARSQQFEFFVVRDRSINAFALPGGFIGIHTGLIAAAANESELATVMSHEIGHVTQRHISRMLSNQRQASLMALAGLVLAALAARSSSDAAIGAMALGDTLAMRSMLSFSRDAEREADRVGWTCFARQSSTSARPRGSSNACSSTTATTRAARACTCRRIRSPVSG
jgi:predicted Zn-dependent protease